MDLKKELRVGLLTLLGIAAIYVGGYWVLFGIGFCESIPSKAAVPVLIPVPSDPSIGGRCAPNLDVTGPPAFKVNSRGYRGPEVVVPKPANTFRVVVAGGPFTFGRDTLDEKNLVGSQLQKILLHNVSNKTIEVVTVGPGAGSRSVKGGILELELGLDVDPDILVWILEYESWDPRGARETWTWVPRRFEGLIPWLSKDPIDRALEHTRVVSTSRKLAEPLDKIGTEAWARSRESYARYYDVRGWDPSVTHGLSRATGSRERIGGVLCCSGRPLSSPQCQVPCRPHTRPPRVRFGVPRARRVA